MLALLILVALPVNSRMEPVGCCWVLPLWPSLNPIRGAFTQSLPCAGSIGLIPCVPAGDPYPLQNKYLPGSTVPGDICHVGGHITALEGHGAIAPCETYSIGAVCISHCPVPLRSASRHLIIDLVRAVLESTQLELCGMCDSTIHFCHNPSYRCIWRVWLSPTVASSLRPCYSDRAFLAWSVGHMNKEEPVTVPSYSITGKCAPRSGVASSSPAHANTEGRTTLPTVIPSYFALGMCMSWPRVVPSLLDQGTLGGRNDW
ncbi:hypothetical protein BJY00DRAFT_158820 [Aspergillus carlsbadensis]|nr:hypothetical protein BJY00DRAFT_158820 [Aspergillus carlsbadensis]